MRILVNHYSPVPNAITGITAYTWGITAALAKANPNEVFLLTNWDKASIPPSLVNSVQFIQGAVPANETLALLSRSITIMRLEKRCTFDVILTPQYFTVLWSKAARVPVVHDLYLSAFGARFKMRRRIQWNIVFPITSARADAIICVSNTTKDDLVRYFPSTASRAVVVHEAPVDFSSNSISVSSNCITGSFGLVVANIEPTKNVELLLDALRLLNQSGGAPHVVIVGTDRQGILAKRLAEEPSIPLTHINRVSAEELACLYKSARCYINTSLSEGFCLPILEAQSRGTPVVCSDIPVLREVAGRGARFIDPRDTRALANSIREVFADDQLVESLSRSALENAKRFSWDRAARETYSVFEQAIKRRRNRNAIGQRSIFFDRN
jgi:glycosyltransferase involved in cell wall biosynthesis